MADYQLTQTGDEVQDILDNSQTGKYFYNQSVATWSSDATYSDYPYKGVITLTGVKGTDGVEVTFSNADATSGNYSPICNTVANGVEIWAKAQDNGLVIPTIHITTGADVQLQGDDAYLPISGGNITGSLSVVGSPVLTENNIPTSIKTFRLASSISVFDEIPQADADWYYKSYAQTGWASAPTGWGTVFRITTNDQRWSWEIALSTDSPPGLYVRSSVNGNAWSAWATK